MGGAGNASRHSTIRRSSTPTTRRQPCRRSRNAFKNDPNTIIGLQSEPHGIGWACWRNGGSSCSVGYAALGMQGALDAVRSTGATNVVTASGIDWANNISQWLTYRPADPAGQLMAETHVYGNNACATTTCLNTEMAPVAAAVPLVFGETGETYDASICGSTNIQRLMGLGGRARRRVSRRGSGTTGATAAR